MILPLMSPALAGGILAHEAPLSMEFSKQEYWSGLPFPSPGDLPNPEIEPKSPALQADSLPSEPLGKQSLPLVPPKKLKSLPSIFVLIISRVGRELAVLHQSPCF